MNITITDVINYRIVGVYDNGGTWTQASGSNFATALAVLDEVPTTTGIKTGTIKAGGETLSAVDTFLTAIVTFKPDKVGTYSGTITTTSNATAQDSSTVTGICENQFNVQYQDKTDYHNYIFGFLR